MTFGAPLREPPPWIEVRYGRPTMHSDASFKAFRRFNDKTLHLMTGQRARLSERGLHHFAGEGLPDKLARALARRRALPAKELFESFELFERVRRRLRRTQVVDLCCGHGLTGMLFAVFEPRVEQVVLVDQRRPESHATVLDAVAEVAPWAVEKITYLEQRLQRVRTDLTAGCAVVAVHACGVRTDRCIDLALALQSPVALVPCCYAQTAASAPRSIRRALGAELATDVHRTYRLEAAGYRVDWLAIPRAITHKNRVLLAVPRLTADSRSGG